jgi:hypothetical protein
MKYKFFKQITHYIEIYIKDEPIILKYYGSFNINEKDILKLLVNHTLHIKYFSDQPIEIIFYTRSDDNTNLMTPFFHIGNDNHISNLLNNYGTEDKDIIKKVYKYLIKNENNLLNN